MMSPSVFDTPEAAEATFYRAFATVDLDLMAAIWCDNDSALCIHPGSGLLRGKKAVMQSWIEILSSKAPPLIEYRLVSEFAHGNLAVRLVEERLRPHDQPAEAATRILATNVYLCDVNSWHLVEHHASLPLIARRKTAGEEHRLH